MISTLIYNKKFEEAFSFYQNMKEEKLLPDEITYILMLKCCGEVSDANFGEKIYKELAENPKIKNNIKIENTMVSLYSKSGEFEKAIEFFDNMKEKDIISYNSMIASYGKHGKGNEGIKLFEKMLKETNLIPDEETFICILSGCSHLGLEKEAEHYLKLMEDKFNIKPNIYHYNCMIDLFSRKGKFEEAENYIKKLKLEDTIKIDVKFSFFLKKIHKNNKN